jgi:hypothetical protein
MEDRHARLAEAMREKEEKSCQENGETNGWTRVRATTSGAEVPGLENRASQSRSAWRAAGGAALLVTCALASHVATGGGSSLSMTSSSAGKMQQAVQEHRLGEAGRSSLSAVVASMEMKGGKGTAEGTLLASMTREGKKEYKLAQLKGEVAQLEQKARDEKLVLKHMQNVLSSKADEGVVADTPRQDRALAVKLSHLSTMYRLKADLANAEFVREDKEGLAETERMQTEGEVSDDKMFAAALASRSKEAEDLALEDKQLSNKMMGYHDKYQLILGKDKEKRELDRTNAAIKAAREKLVEEESKMSHDDKRLPDEKTAARDVSEAMSIEKLQKRGTQ